MAPRVLAGAAAFYLLLAAPMQADGPLQSGPPVGARNNRSGFMPQWVTGPCANERLCPV